MDSRSCSAMILQPLTNSPQPLSVDNPRPLAAMDRPLATPQADYGRFLGINSSHSQIVCLYKGVGYQPNKAMKSGSDGDRDRNSSHNRALDTLF